MIGNINIINKRVASKLNLSDKKVKEINETYFKYLRRTLSNGIDTNYFVRDLGTFSVDLRSIRYELFYTLGAIRKMLGKPNPPTDLIEEYKKNFSVLWKQYDNLRLQIMKRQKFYAEKRKTKLDLINKETTEHSEGIHIGSTGQE